MSSCQRNETVEFSGGYQQVGKASKASHSVTVSSRFHCTMVLKCSGFQLRFAVTVDG